MTDTHTTQTDKLNVPFFIRGSLIDGDAPVDFHPTHKTSNVVVDSLDDAVRYVNVATQTIGIYPYQRKAQLRDKLAGAGAQRLCRVGTANGHVAGSPHDAMYPLARFVHWMGDDDILTADSNAVIAGEFGI